MSENIPLSFSINEIKVISSLFYNEKPESTIEKLKLATDVEVEIDLGRSQLSVTVSFEIVEPITQKILAFIKVLNSFSVENMGNYNSGGSTSDKTNLPTKIMDHFLTLASSHARGIFSHLSKSTPFESFMVPNLQNKDLSK